MKACLILVLVGVAMMGPAAGEVWCPNGGEATLPKVSAEKPDATPSDVVDCAALPTPLTTCKVTFTEATNKFKWECTADPPGDKKCITKAEFGTAVNGVFTCFSASGATGGVDVQPVPADLKTTTAPVNNGGESGNGGEQSGGGSGGATKTTVPPESSGNSFKPGYLPFVVAAVVVLGKSFVAV